jgi:hypothetical protein
MMLTPKGRARTRPFVTSGWVCQRTHCRFTLALRSQDPRLTAGGDHHLVRKLTISALTVLAAAALAGAAGAMRLPRAPNLPAGWSHAQINVVVRGVAHTLTYDRGRVVSIGAGSLTLREPDGTMQTIGVDASAQIRIAGQPGTLDQIRRLEIATTVSVDGGPAAVVKVQIPPGVAAALARQARRSGSAG